MVEIDWKSCSGARASISTLKMKPASAAPCEAADDQRPGVEEGLFAEHDQQHRRGEAAAAGEGEILAGASRPVPPGMAGSERRAVGSPRFFARRAKANGTTSRLTAPAPR